MLWRSSTQEAFKLIGSRESQSAFQLEQEADSLRQRYGRRTIGQSCLLARRLVQRGVPFVTVNYKGWDTHNDGDDSDGDGICDGVDICQGFDDNLDTDGDGYSNGCDDTQYLI